MRVDEKGLADELRPYASKALGSIRIDVSEVAKIVAALDRLTAYEAAKTAEGAVADMRRVCEALGFDPTNHHNAAKCPYCTPSLPAPPPPQVPHE